MPGVGMQSGGVRVANSHPVKGFLCHGHFPCQSLSFLICARGTIPQVRHLPGGWEGQKSTFCFPNFSHSRALERFVPSEPHLFCYVLKLSHFFP